MPKISKTEDAALQAGTVGLDGELFNGNPSLKDLVKKYDVALRPDETAYMNDQVEKLCALLDDYQVTRDRDMPENVWEYLKKEKVRDEMYFLLLVILHLPFPLLYYIITYIYSYDDFSFLEWLFLKNMVGWV
jgi:hypothetical protein